MFRMSESRHATCGSSPHADSDTSQGGAEGLRGGAEGREPWFADGLRFSCTMCGHCCSGGRGSVKLEAHEAAGMAAKLQVSQDTFYDKYTRKSRGPPPPHSPPLREVKCCPTRHTHHIRTCHPARRPIPAPTFGWVCGQNFLSFVVFASLCCLLGFSFAACCEAMSLLLALSVPTMCLHKLAIMCLHKLAIMSRGAYPHTSCLHKLPTQGRYPGARLPQDS